MADDFHSTKLPDHGKPPKHTEQYRMHDPDPDWTPAGEDHTLLAEVARVEPIFDPDGGHWKLTLSLTRPRLYQVTRHSGDGDHLSDIRRLLTSPTGPMVEHLARSGAGGWALHMWLWDEEGNRQSVAIASVVATSVIDLRTGEELPDQDDDHLPKTFRIGPIDWRDAPDPDQVYGIEFFAPNVTAIYELEVVSPALVPEATALEVVFPGHPPAIFGYHETRVPRYAYASGPHAREATMVNRYPDTLDPRTTGRLPLPGEA